MWLLDANMDVHLTDLLRGYGIGSEAATRRGWARLTNGELVAAAGKAGFTCVLTQDRLFAKSAARSLELHPDLCIVVVCLAQRPWREYRGHCRGMKAMPFPSPTITKPAQKRGDA
jgi:hypothetical protein